MISQIDLAEYLEHDPFLEFPEPPGGQSPPDQHTAPLKPASPVTPDRPKRSAQTERDKQQSDLLYMVMEVFPGAMWVTKDEYKRRAAQRDRQWGKRRGKY